jgi:hypothetical protein
MQLETSKEKKINFFTINPNQIIQKDLAKNSNIYRAVNLTFAIRFLKIRKVHPN